MTNQIFNQKQMTIRPFLLTAILFCALLWPTAVSHAQSEPIPVEAFWQLVAESQQAVRLAENLSPEEQIAELNRLANELGGITAVSTPNNPSIPLNPGSFVTELRTVPPDFERLDALFTTLLGSRESWPAPLFDETAQSSLETVLAQSQFQYDTEPSWLQEQIQKLRQRWVDFLSSLLPEDTVINIPLGNIISIFAAIILTLILIYVTKDLFLEFAGNATLDPEDDIGGEPLTADTALKRAQSFSEDGDYRTAVRYLYLSALLLLEERGLLRYNRSLTNREYLRSVAHQPELATVLHDVIDVFDRVWYGFQPLAEKEYRMYARQVNTLKQQKGVR